MPECFLAFAVVALVSGGALEKENAARKEPFWILFWKLSESVLFLGSVEA